MSVGSHRICEACGIRERRCANPLYFARFPVDEVRCKAWVKAVGKEDLIHLPLEKLNTLKCVCGNHFHKKYFTKKGNLKKNAIPTQNLPLPPLPDEMLNDFPLHMAKQKKVVAPEVEQTGEQAPSSSSSAITHKAMLSNVIQNPTVVAPEVEQTGEQAPSSSSSAITHEAMLSHVIQNPTETSQEQRPVETMEVAVTKRKSSVNLDWSPRKKKLVERLNKTKCTLKSLRRSSILIEKIESPVLKELVINTCKNQHRKPTGRRWTTQHKVSCLAIFKRSPKTYRYLSAAVTLPSIKTLQNILKKVPMQPGICKAVLNHLNILSKKKHEKDKMCSLVFDEMAIKSRIIYNEARDLVEGFQDLGESGRSDKIADHVLVFMIQGIRQKFKQPLAFYFTKGTISSARLAELIKDIIVKVSSCGFKILCTICDQGPTNIGALKILRQGSGPSDDIHSNYFKVIDKVFILWDVPHLFKSIRNNFMNAGSLVLGTCKGKWEHVLEVEEQNRNFLYLSKITESHVKPQYRAKMKVKLAAQILSNTVAAVLKLLARAATSDKASDLLSTAYVIEDLDKLFDSTNGPSGPHDVKKGRRENVSTKTNHMNIWADYIKKISKSKFIKNGRECTNVRCLEGYLISLKSLRDIWSFLLKNGFKYMNLRNLNQDALENLFGMIRQHSPTNRNPTATHFIAAIKTAVVTGLTGPHSRGSNCEIDQMSLLTDFHDIALNENSEDEETQNKENVSSICEDEAEYPVLSVPETEIDDNDKNYNFTLIEQQPIVYIAGFLAHKIFKTFKCEDCKRILTVETPQANPIYTYILLREWYENKFSLTYPSIFLCKIVKELIDITENELLLKLHEPNICALGVTLYTSKYSSLNFGCCTHSNEIANKCFELLCKLLIRRQCNRVNKGFASREEELANLNKKGEQQAKAK